MRRTSIFSILVLVLALLSSMGIKAQQHELSEMAQKCFKCHGNHQYSFDNYFTDVRERKLMNPYFIIDSLAYTNGVHGSFSCDDCHSPDYLSYPHNAELKLEFKYTCQDCHAGDPAFANLHFDEIELEVQNSVHVNNVGEAFRCELCHDPHTNRLVASSGDFSIQEIVLNDNNVCLKCHNNDYRFHILTERERPEIIQTHDWLPNQALHFKNVRCIECHTARNDTMMVAHRILSKSEAVKKCAECHTQNSLLNAKLYKYISKEQRGELGVYKAMVRNEAYVIGANRIPFLNIASLLIFGLTLLGVAIHIVARIIKRN